MIHDLALVDPGARVAADASIGPWCMVGPNVEIGSETVLESHVVIKGPSLIGCNNHIYQFSSIGESTPDRKYGGEPTTLVMGDHNVVREGVTIHRGTVPGRGETRIGNHNLFMAYVHIGHDSVVGDHTVLVNNTALAGHVQVGDWVTLSGYTLVHQYCKIGSHSFSGMGTAIGKDVPAFVTVSGSPAQAKTVNIEGMRRRGFSRHSMACVRRAFKILYKQGLTLEAALQRLEALSLECAEVDQMVQSLLQSQRGIVR